MRIAVAVHNYPPLGRGGVESVASEQAAELVSRGHEVFVFAREATRARPEGVVREEVVDGVAVYWVAVPDRPRSPFSDYYEGRFLDRCFAGFLSEVAPDVVHVQHLISLSNRIVALAHGAAIPVVLSLHDAYYLCDRIFLLDAAGRRCAGPDAGLRCVDCLAEHGVGEAVRQRFDAMARLLDGVDALTAPSPSLRRRYEAEFPFLTGRIEVVEPGLARRPRAGSPSPRSGAPLRLLFVGTLLPHKGLDLLIEALEPFAEDSVELTIYGEEVASGRAWLEELRARTRGRRVSWRGMFRPAELDDVLAAADVLVAPSRCDESWSRTVREARAAGLAVVTTSTGGPADWLADGVDALLVEPDSVASLRAALDRLRADDELRVALATPATTIPDVAGAVAKFEAIFARVVAAKGSQESSEVPRVSIAYVTKNAAPWLEESLAAVRAQRGAFDLVEILAVDSGSTDATREILARHGARLVEIAPGEFGHGRTRNLAAREARGDIVVFLTQDAAPADQRWLVRLLEALAADPLCAAAWSRHVPRSDCHPMEWRILAEHPPFLEQASAIQSARGNPDWSTDPDRFCSLSNNAAAYRREVLLRVPFPDVAFAEDRLWARRILQEGWRTVLVRDSVIRHSHAYSPWRNLRRHFDHAWALAEEGGEPDDFTLVAGWRASLREARRDVRFWSQQTGEDPKKVALRWALPATLYHLGAFGGRWLGAHVGWLPAGVAERLSLHRVSDRAQVGS